MSLSNAIMIISVIRENRPKKGDRIFTPIFNQIFKLIFTPIFKPDIFLKLNMGDTDLIFESI